MQACLTSTSFQPFLLYLPLPGDLLGQWCENPIECTHTAQVPVGSSPCRINQNNCSSIYHNNPHFYPFNQSLTLEFIYLFYKVLGLFFVEVFNFNCKLVCFCSIYMQLFSLDLFLYITLFSEQSMIFISFIMVVRFMFIFELGSRYQVRVTPDTAGQQPVEKCHTVKTWISDYCEMLLGSVILVRSRSTLNTPRCSK